MRSPRAAALAATAEGAAALAGEPLARGGRVVGVASEQDPVCDLARRLIGFLHFVKFIQHALLIALRFISVQRTLKLGPVYVAIRCQIFKI